MARASKPETTEPELVFNGFDEPEENWSKLPHALIGMLPLIKTISEMKVILYILRHTWGFRDEWKKITVDEFVHGRKRKDGTRIDNGTGLTEPSIRAGLDEAEKHGFIQVETDDRDKGRVQKFYSLKMAQGEKVLPPDLKSFTPRGKNSLPRTEKDTMEKKPIENGPAKNAAADLDEWFPESTPNGRKPEHESLLAQIQNGSTDQANQARLIALGLSAKEQAPTTGLEQIELANWRIKDDRIRQGMAIFLEAVPLPVPVSRSERGQWLKGISAHLEEFGLTGLKELYRTAWNEYLPDITAGKLDITHPLALTRKMRGIRSRPQPTTQEAKYFIDPDTGERIKW